MSPMLVNPYRFGTAGGGGGSGAAVKIGSFLTGTATAGNTVAVTGVGFTPKAIIFWWNGLNTSGNQLNRSNLRHGFGFAVSSSDRRCVTGQEVDASAGAQSDGGAGDESCVRALNTSGALAGALDVQTMDSDGFTLVVDTQFSTDLRVHYFAVGGTGITNVKGGRIGEPASTGNQATTGLGFAPDVVLFLTNVTGSLPSQAPHCVQAFGYAVKSSAQNYTGWCVTDTQANCTAHGESGVSIGRIIFNGGQLQAYGSVSSFDSDGFTVNWVARSATGIDYLYLALKGGSWAAGELLTQTDTVTTSVVSGLGFAPVGVLFSAHGNTESATPNGNNHAQIVMGAATSATDRVCTYAQSENGQNPTRCHAGQRTDAVYLTGDLSATSGVNALMDVQSFDSGGFTCIMDDAAPAQTWVGYLAVG